MEQITHYHDERKLSPYCHRVEIALMECGASYTSHGFDIYNKPAWFAQANPLTGKIPVLTYGGPKVPPEEPSPLSSKITESFVILEFLADLFPQSTLRPSDPVARAHVRLFMNLVIRDVEVPMYDVRNGVPGAREKLLQGLEKLQALLPDTKVGPYVSGKQFTIADCAIAPLLAAFAVFIKSNYGGNDTAAEENKQFGEALEGPKFERLRQYKKAMWERESIKTVLDLERLEEARKAVFGATQK